MKRNKLLYGFLAATLLMTSVAWPAAEAKAETPDPERGLTAYYSFDDTTLENGVEGGNDATAIVTGLGAYGGSPVYDENGREGAAVRLGDYGLELNQKNLGDSFTVSMWVKPDRTFAENQCALFLGYHNPEQWVAVSGKANNSPVCKIWANGNGYGWTGFGELSLKAGNWYQLTVTGDSQNVTAYLDGKQVSSNKTNQPLTGTNQDVYIGANNWDAEFTGLVDEVRVYGRTLSSTEVLMLYDGRTAVDVLKEMMDDITAADSLKLSVNRTKSIDLKLPEGILEAGASVSCESSDPDVASVDSEGAVTGGKAGTATITTTVSLDGKTVTRTTAVTVSDSLEDELAAYYRFEGGLNDEKGGASAAAVVKGLGAYNGTISYDAAGKDGQAIALRDFGLKLNRAALGEEFTVSLWLKPNSSFAENQILLFLGHHDPENWTAVSGSGNASECKIWSKGDIYSTWTTHGTAKISAGEWHQLVLTGTSSTMTAYLDGRKAASAATNHPLAGKNQDIYIGVNNWDRTFDGLVDEVKVYAADMTEDQVQNQDREYFEQMLTSWMNDTLALKPRKILGENKSVNEIKYDLKLPSEVDGLPIIWSSSDESIIKPDGTVANPEQKTTVTLTATVNAGMLSASREYQLTVLGLDRTGLNELIAKAESIRTEKLAEVSRARLEQALKEAKEADGYSSIRTAYAHLQQAVEELCYLEDYRNPFPSVVAPELYAAVKEDVGVQLFTLPAGIKDAVEVTYVSEKPELVSYTDGEIRGLKPGKAVVTVIVTSQYDQWQMEYSTAVTIEEKTEAPGGNPSTGDSSGTNNSGNSGNTGGTGSSGGSGKSSSSHRGSSDDAAPAAAPAAVAAGQGAAVTTAVRGPVGAQLTGGNAGVQGETGETADGTPAETLTPDDGELQKNEETPPEIRDVEDEEVPQAGIEKPEGSSFSIFPIILIIAILACMMIYFLIAKKSREEQEEN